MSIKDDILIIVESLEITLSSMVRQSHGFSLLVNGEQSIDLSVVDLNQKRHREFHNKLSSCLGTLKSEAEELSEDVD